jgi:hypothetical protein
MKNSTFSMLYLPGWSTESYKDPLKPAGGPAGKSGTWSVVKAIHAAQKRTINSQVNLRKNLCKLLPEFSGKLPQGLMIID